MTSDIGLLVLFPRLRCKDRVYLRELLGLCYSPARAKTSRAGEANSHLVQFGNL